MQVHTERVASRWRASTLPKIKQRDATRRYATRRVRCELSLSLTLVWFDASTCVNALGVNRVSRCKTKAFYLEWHLPSRKLRSTFSWMRSRMSTQMMWIRTTHAANDAGIRPITATVNIRLPHNKHRIISCWILLWPDKISYVPRIGGYLETWPMAHVRFVQIRWVYRGRRGIHQVSRAYIQCPHRPLTPRF